MNNKNLHKYNPNWEQEIMKSMPSREVTLPYLDGFVFGGNDGRLLNPGDEWGTENLPLWIFLGLDAAGYAWDAWTKTIDGLPEYKPFNTLYRVHANNITGVFSPAERRRDRCFYPSKIEKLIVDKVVRHIEPPQPVLDHSSAMLRRVWDVIQQKKIEIAKEKGKIK